MAKSTFLKENLRERKRGFSLLFELFMVCKACRAENIYVFWIADAFFQDLTQYFSARENVDKNLWMLHTFPSNCR